MPINYNKYYFTDPAQLVRWKASNYAGIYAILIPDKFCKPLSYRVVYFDETENFAKCGIDETHSKYSCWMTSALKKSNIYISVHYMRDSTAEQRQAVVSALIQKCQPSCNF